MQIEETEFIILYLLPFYPQRSLTIFAGNIIRAKGVVKQQNKVCITLPLYLLQLEILCFLLSLFFFFCPKIR